MPSPKWLALGALLSLGVAACADNPLSAEPADIRVCANPADVTCSSPISFGELSADEAHDLTLIVRNIGQGKLVVQSVDVVSGDGVVIGEVPSTVTSGGAEPLAVIIVPIQGPGSAVIRVTSNDPDTPKLDVELLWQGIGPALVFCPTAGLDATPSHCAEMLRVSTAEPQIGHIQEIHVRVRNAGAVDLFVRDAEIDDQSTIPGELAVATAVSSGNLRAGTEVPMVVQYVPQDLAPDTLTVTLTTMDGVVPPATLQVTSASLSNEPPVAEAAEYETGATSFTAIVSRGVWIDGRASSDPEGDPLQYRWTVTERPEGSTVPPDTPLAKLTRFAADRIGTYGLHLTVADSLGQTDTAEVEFVAEARDFLTVRASWGEEVGDVDLHLIPEGALLFGPADCFFAQSAVDWGTPGSDLDDPEHLADDVSGTGAEMVRISRPSSGRYYVYANYFEVRGTDAAAVEVTVLADDESVTLGTQSGNLTSICETWEVGVITWPDRTFEAGTSPNSTHCYLGGTP